MTTIERQIVYDALVCHDGRSLMPEWATMKQVQLTEALDKLRAILRRGKRI